MKRKLLVILFLFLCSCAKNHAQDPSSGELDHHDGEKLVFSAPGGFKLKAKKMNSVSRYYEYESAAIGERKTVRLVIFDDFKAVKQQSASVMLRFDTQQRLLNEKCPAGNKIVPGYFGHENGYQTATATYLCSQDLETERGVVNLDKEISGDRSLYIINIEIDTPRFMVDPIDAHTAEVIAEWEMYLDQIRCCNDKDSKKMPCSAPTSSIRH